MATKKITDDKLDKISGGVNAPVLGENVELNETTGGGGNAPIDGSHVPKGGGKG